MISIPMAALIVLILAGLWLGELGWKGALGFVALWFAGLAAFNGLGLPRAAFVAVEVLLDVVLILKIFGSDLQIR